MNSTNLFTPISRDDRQKQCIVKWIKNNCIGTCEAATGFGKTRIGLKIIQLLKKRQPKLKTLVVVPTETLKNQWLEELKKFNIIENTDVQIINTVIKKDWECDLMVQDEQHRYASGLFQQVFSKVKYKYILGLTATLERLDGRHIIIEKYCPIIDSVSLETALLNHWVSEHIEYKILIDVDDINVYKKYDKEFAEHFAYFDYNFPLCMNLIGKNGYKKRWEYVNKICKDKEKQSSIFKSVTYHATRLMQLMQLRKKFINTHPKKLEIVRDIIKYRQHCKIITFSSTVAMAEKIGVGYVYSGKDSKKKGRMTMEEFSKKKSGVINSCSKLNEGMDCPGLNVGIILGMDSSPTKAIQRKGRVIRLESNKKAEIFTLVINDTKEEAWFQRSHPDKNYVTLDVKNLYRMLRGEEFEIYKRKEKKVDLDFRF